jgi:hypothetical protein
VEASNGLPLPPTEPPALCEVGADVEAGSSIRLGREGSGDRLVGADAGVSVEVTCPRNLEVERAPVTMRVGSITMGTTICRVLPLLSVVVVVNVERMVLVSSVAVLLTFAVFCLLVVRAGVRVDCVDSSSESDSEAAP